MGCHVRARRPLAATAAGLALAFGAWVSAEGAGEPSARPPERPNVILILTDDQGYGDLACLGNPVIQTPNLDALHADSVRLTDFHVDPTCSPTRAALMTGRYSGRVGVWHTIMGRSILREGETTMPEVFSRSGYATALFGKWHLGDNAPSRPQDRGFSRTLVHGGGGVGQTPDVWGNDYFDDTYLDDGRPRPTVGYCTDVWFDAALQFIGDQADAGRPFFCEIATNAPHAPYRVPERYEAMYANNPEVPNAAFYGMITNIDENVGRLLSVLDERGLSRETLVIFMTDNGTAAGVRGGVGFNAGMRGQKGSPYDGGHRVPCFLRWPGGGLSGGRDVDRLSAHLDLLPTLIDLCGLSPPEGVAFDGKSLAPLLRAEEADWPERVLVVESQRVENPIKYRQCAVMTERWRLVNGAELYDIEHDPGQSRDVADEHPEVVSVLRDQYERWWADVSREHGQVARIVLGSDRENPSRLTCHDWHEADPPWNQSMIRQGKVANGFWTVEVARDGLYEIELRRWPAEEPRPINDGPGPKAETARVSIAGVDLSRPVGPEDLAVLFRTPLPAGPARLQTWLEGPEGTRGAYFVSVRLVSD
ncbi:arylsulfatase [Tautonia sociabilis]|uniref:N-acetylgalactosamine-4-sulfatase n=1 Tax=Tautonia sociabilis TaxID=2080755 RepID=A0A432MH11_9BACT|nr:arylsulfatase [Tautonia sociabilis]RUL86116.1 N-acetylgalactosamine-4-sulfatase [Tautonia sociabilis]